jgi:hypothetical protein
LIAARAERPGRFAFPERVLVEAEPLIDVHPDDRTTKTQSHEGVHLSAVESPLC